MTDDVLSLTGFGLTGDAALLFFVAAYAAVVFILVSSRRR